MSLEFITLREFSGRNVSFAISSKDRNKVQLLGVLPHCTTFDRRDLVSFAREVIKRLDDGSPIAKTWDDTDPQEETDLYHARINASEDR